MANRGHISIAGRVTAAILALALGAVLLPGGAAAAPSQKEVEQAKHKAAVLASRVQAARDELATISAQVGAVTEQVLQAQDRLNAIQTELNKTREELAVTQARYDAVAYRLTARAHDAYIEGPGSGLEFILGATSLTDLSDRVTFLDAVQQSDADLATQVENLANQLATEAARQEKLEVKQAALVNDLRAKRADLQAAQGRQQDILDRIEADRREAAALADKLGKQRAAWLRAQLAPTTSNGVFKVCPVAQPRSFGDGFGAPRYGGGFHLHMGVDIVAPTGTPIYAPFDGVARRSYNGLGGNAVYVTGATGFVYNAHLSAYSEHSDGAVKAGETIGYVGATGDAQGGIAHDHFEYHPNVIPSNWPASAYGYSVIDGAINPYPLLVAACY
jgi:murein DD-endopeptidase MepM/ murein hydrolase activator NlpD